MTRRFALERGFRDRERRRVSVSAAIAVALVALIAVAVAAARPGWPVTMGAFVGSVIVFAVVTFVVAAVSRPRDVARALELYRWVARADRIRWRAATGDPPPSTPARARVWLAAHPARGASSDLPRIELLLWIGEFEAARAVALALPEATPTARYDRALELARIRFVASGDGDLEPVRVALDELGADSAAAATRLAVEEARRRAAQRIDFLPPLLAAREALGRSIDGFLVPDLARWVARPLLLLGLLSAVVTFVAAGALPPR